MSSMMVKCSVVGFIVLIASLLSTSVGLGLLGFLVALSITKGKW